MLKRQLAITGLGVVVLMASGCATSTPSGGGIETKSYVAVKDRIDQNMEGGNYGYIMGTPKEPDRSNIRKTRQVYVLEFTKNPEVDVEDVKAQMPKPEPAPAPSPRRTPVAAPAPVVPQEEEPITLPRWDDVAPAAPAPVSVEPETEAQVTGGTSEYIVQKGDTLQKISKKFYNSFSKWPRIYEANKDVIPNPNKIKPGIKILIPE